MIVAETVSREVCRHVSSVTGCSVCPDDLSRRKGRSTGVVSLARRHIMYTLHEFYGMSYRDIARVCRCHKRYAQKCVQRVRDGLCMMVGEDVRIYSMMHGDG